MPTESPTKTISSLFSHLAYNRASPGSSAAGSTQARSDGSRSSTVAKRPRLSSDVDSDDLDDDGDDDGKEADVAAAGELEQR